MPGPLTAVKRWTRWTGSARAIQQTLQAARANERALLQIPLLGGTVVRALERHSEWSADGQTLIWSGDVSGTMRGQVVMAITGDLVSANVTDDAGGLVQIRPGPGGTHTVSEVDFAQRPPEESPLAPELESAPAPSAKAPAARAAGPADTTLDVLVAYTRSMREAAGGTAAALNLIQLGVAEANQGYANSGVVQRIRLVHAAEVDYPEAGLSFPDLLRRVRSPNDGHLDEVPALRNQYGADLVSLWVNNGSSCGMGYVMMDLIGDFADWAYSVVHYGCATGGYTFAHELGHNQGCQHNCENADPFALFPFAYGYRQTSAAPFFRTMMAYNCPEGCGRINYWSNPEGIFQGQVTGSNQADNRRTLNETLATAANWRQRVVPLTGNASRVRLTTSVQPGGGGQIRLNPAAPDGLFTAGTEVEIQADRNPGWTFVGFSGDVTGRQNPQRVNMNGPRSIVANYVGQLFDDVPPSHSQFDHIGILRFLNITAGCNASPPRYCPESPVTRGQMAVFVIRSLFAGDNFPFPAQPYFEDVPADHPQFRFIQKMREVGITGGCSTTPARFCPEAPVTRGQMAVFLVRAKWGEQFPFPSQPYFDDVPAADPAFRFVQKLREQGITSGCSAVEYCSNRPTTRGQMAVFLTRTFFDAP